MIKFKVGVNGAIDESKVFSNEGDAKNHAMILWHDFSDDGDSDAGCQSAVYGYDDALESHTPFWRHWYIDELGMAHSSGE